MLRVFVQFFPFFCSVFFFNGCVTFPLGYENKFWTSESFVAVPSLTASFSQLDTWRPCCTHPEHEHHFNATRANVSCRIYRSETGADIAYVPRVKKAHTMSRVLAACRSSPQTVCSWVRVEHRSPSQLVITDWRKHSLLTLCFAKGTSQGYTEKALAHNVMSTGHQIVLLLNNQEPGIVDVKHKAGTHIPTEIVYEESPVGDSNANGGVERANQTKPNKGAHAGLGHPTRSQRFRRSGQFAETSKTPEGHGATFRVPGWFFDFSWMFFPKNFGLNCCTIYCNITYLGGGTTWRPLFFEKKRKQALRASQSVATPTKVFEFVKFILRPWRSQPNVLHHNDMQEPVLHGAFVWLRKLWQIHETIQAHGSNKSRHREDVVRAFCFVFFQRCFVTVAPCSLAPWGRLEDVARTLRADIFLCPVSRIRAMIGEPCSRWARWSWPYTSGGHEMLTPIEVLPLSWKKEDLRPVARKGRRAASITSWY